MDSQDLLTKQEVIYNSNLRPHDYIKKKEFNLLNLTGVTDSFWLGMVVTIWALSITADCLMIRAIKKFKILKTWENNVILHWSWFNLLYLVLQPGIYTLFVKFVRFRAIYCFLSDIPDTLLVTGMAGAAFLLFSWLFFNSKYAFGIKFRIHYKANCVFAIYVFGTIVYATTFLSCHFKSLKFRVTYMIVYAMIVVCIVLNIARYFVVNSRNREPKITKYVIYVANTVILSYLPLLISKHLFQVTDSTNVNNVLHYTIIISELLVLSNPILVYLILYKSNNDFNRVFRAIVSCKNQSVEKIEMTPADVIVKTSQPQSSVA